jgi:4'-phosphopantetheinyl transferase
MIHVLLGSERPEKLDWLAPGERDRAVAMAIPWRRAEFLLGRWTAKKLLSSVLGCAPDHRLEIRPDASGRPQAFLDGRALPVSLSISHRGGLAFAAVDDTGEPLGADLELIEARSDAFVRDFFTPREAEVVSRGDREVLANLIWSAKESALKALGEGLRLDTRAVEIEIAPGAPSAWQRLRVHGAAESGGWWRTQGHHVITVVGRGAGEPQLV